MGDYYRRERSYEGRYPRENYRYDDRERDEHYRSRDRYPLDRDEHDRDRDRRSVWTDRDDSSHSHDYRQENEPAEVPRDSRSERHRAHDDQYDAGKPNSQIIFRGLDKDVTELDVYDIYSVAVDADFHSCNNFLSINRALLLKV